MLQYFKTQKSKQQEFLMSNFSKIFIKTKGQIKKYLRQKLTSLNNPQKRMVNEIFYGILHSGDVMLSEIARSLQEPATIKKTIERLSRNLSKKDISSFLDDNHLADLSLMVNDDSIIVLDDTDINKPRAKKMEALCPIRDGSTGETGTGYYVQNSCIVNSDRTEIKSIMNKVYSTKEDDYISRGYQREQHLKKLFNAFGKKGIYVMDRGFSEQRIFQYFNNNMPFVCRAKDRNIIYKNKIKHLYSWASKIKLPHFMIIKAINKNGEHKVKPVQYAVRKIKINNRDMWSVILKLEDHHNTVLLTNQKPDFLSDAQFGQKIIEQYGCRWSVEEKIRFEKQEFKYENIRVRNMVAIRNMMAIINLVSSFISHISFEEISIKIIEISKAIKDDVRLSYYRIAEGIKKIFRMRNAAVFKFKDYRHYFKKAYQIEFWEL